MRPSAGVQFRHVHVLNESVSSPPTPGAALYVELVVVRHDPHLPQEPARKRLLLLVLAHKNVLHSPTSHHRSQPRAIN